MVAQEYADALRHYVDLGNKLQLAHRIQVTEEKVQQVLQDAAIGGAIGGVIPGLGEIGLSEALGSYIGGVYGAFDQFGGDVVDAVKDVTGILNPPDFQESDYDRMRRACLKSGGVPHPNYAPDNECGCIYPDGTTSGGEYPRHPPPGVQSIRGDVPIPALPPGMCWGPMGFPIPCSSLPPPPKPKPIVHAVRGSLLKGLVKHMPPAPMPTVKAKPRPVYHAAKIAPATLNQAHVVVAAVKQNDEGARAFVDDVMAKAAAGDPTAQIIHAALTQAQKLQIRAKYIQKYVYGGTARPVNTGAIPRR